MRHQVMRWGVQTRPDMCQVSRLEESAWLQAVSGGQPAHAMVMAGALSARGSPVPGHELQSQPISRTDSHQDPAPQIALTVIMPSG